MIKYYRITYNDIGIYEAFKQNVCRDAWQTFKNSELCDWLPTPPLYLPTYKSYFTKAGYDIFMKIVYPLFIKYLDVNNINVITIKSIEQIVYEDKYQIVVKGK